MKTVFIVEDDDSILELYRQWFIMRGFEIVGLVKDGGEAISKYCSLIKKPDIIIMDHHLPVKNGIEVMKEILEIDSKAKIIIASADKGVKDSALSAGAVSFKLKPFILDDFVKEIEEIVSRKTLLVIE